MCGLRKRWIPAFAGMTYRGAGMTYRRTEMTYRRVGMTEGIRRKR